ncbi:MAG TPA: folate-binding protein [Stellaceae bacterium]|nr:folate-binding protein [Stellaceae bacterium]
MDEPLRYCVLGRRGLLELGGADRVAFLQGLVSNDVTRAAPDRALHAALLTPQGKYLHDFFVAAADDVLLLDVEAARRDDLRRRLALYKLRSKIALVDASERFEIVAAFGAGAPRALGLGDGAGAARPWSGGVAFVDPRLAALGTRLILPRGTAPAALEAAGFVAADEAQYDRLRLSLGVPDGSRDLEIEKSILLEAGFDELNGIDWQKGCYIGQELTARTRYRGLVKKRLMPVAVEGPLPPPDTIIRLGDAEAGEMRSGRDGLGLALLRLEAVAEAERAHQPLTAGDARLTPRKPDWFKES